MVARSTDKDDLCIKLIDFGFAKVTEENKQLTEFMGTPWFIAPEIVSS